MSKASDNDKKWLVKAAGRVLGPFAFDEVATSLKQRRVTLIDEIKAPGERWTFIRENKHFSELIKSIREDERTMKEDTSATVAGHQTVTQDLTPPPVSVATESSRNPNLAEVLETSANVVERPVTPAYVATKDPRNQKKFQNERRRSASYGWIFLALVLIGIGTFQFYPRGSEHQKLGFDDLITLAKTSRSIGQFERALDFYRKAESLRPLDPGQQLQMIPLLMVVENQNVQARQLLEQLAGHNIDRFQKEIENLLALTYLRESRLDEAQKRYSEIVSKDRDNEAAQLNLTEILILQGEFEKANSRINELMKLGFKSPELFLFRILTIYRTAEDPDKLESAKTDLKRLLNQFKIYRSEMFLLLAAIQKKMNQDLDVGDSLKNLLSTDPDMTRRHLNDWMIHREILEWGYLANICDIIVNNSVESPMSKGLAAFCTYQQGDLKKALEQLASARNRFSADPTLIGLHSFLLFKSGRLSETKAMFQLAKSGDSELATTVKAMACEAQEDWSCAEESWRRLLQNDSRAVAAYAGLARVALANRQGDLAQDYLKRGLLISSQYLPLLELKEQINEN